MSASPAPSAVPPNALRMWTDGVRIYVELPGLAGPYIVAYLYSEGGLAKALNILGVNRVDYDHQGTIPAGYLKPKPTPGTSTQQAHSEAVGRRLGFIK